MRKKCRVHRGMRGGCEGGCEDAGDAFSAFLKESLAKNFIKIRVLNQVSTPIAHCAMGVVWFTRFYPLNKVPCELIRIVPF